VKTQGTFTVKEFLPEVAFMLMLPETSVSLSPFSGRYLQTEGRKIKESPTVSVGSSNSEDSEYPCKHKCSQSKLLIETSTSLSILFVMMSSKGAYPFSGIGSAKLMSFQARSGGDTEMSSFEEHAR